MTPAQIELVRDGFARLAADREGLAAEFYERLFTLEPSLRALFQSDLKSQGVKLVTALAFVVKGLDRLDAILDDVRALGRRHVAYGVQDSDYDTVGTALVGTLAARLGDRFDAPAQAAWTAAYTALAGVMKEAAQSATGVEETAPEAKPASRAGSMVRQPGPMALQPRLAS